MVGGAEGLDIRSPLAAALLSILAAAGAARSTQEEAPWVDHERIYEEAREGVAHLRRFLALAADQAGL